ncbi:MAG: hypothetical protein HQL54_10860 [Magnetococcales bacterium]|nr:hypothetical protein [Magnetococcales bacterium]
MFTIILSNIKSGFRIFSIIATLCATLFMGGNATSATEPNEAKGDGLALPVHGRFCGPNYPKLNAENKADELKELESIKAFDTIDSACKNHDICYARKGYFDYQCDQQFVMHLQRLTLATPACQTLAYEMGMFVARINPSYNREADAVSRLSYLPGKAMGSMMSFPFDAVEYATIRSNSAAAERWDHCEEK